MPSDVEDLVSFLNERNKQEVRKTAADIISGLTATAEGIEQLQPVQTLLLAGLLRLVPGQDTELSKSALTALVNLSQDPRWAEQLLKHNIVGRVMEFIREKSCPHMELLLMLLVNVTITDQGCEDLLQLGKPGMEGLHMALLLKAFVTSAVTLLPGQPDPYQHIAALLTNTTRLQQGRQMLLQPGRGFLHALVAQLQPGCSLQRRRGCSGALRNVAISAEADGTLEQLVSDEAVLSRLLAPLGGEGAAAAAAHTTSTSTPAAAAAVGAANGAAGQSKAADVAGTGTHEASAAATTSSSSSNGVVNGSADSLHTQMNGLHVGDKDAANGSSSTTNSSSSLRDPDDGVREALAEAIAVLAATDIGRKALWKVSAPELLRKAYEDEACPEVCRAMELAARSFMFDCDATQLEEAQEAAAATLPALPEAAAVEGEVD